MHIIAGLVQRLLELEAGPSAFEMLGDA